MGQIITLCTDFGVLDGYVAAMKGVILSIAPQATLVDISHEIPPQDVLGGAFVLHTAAARWRCARRVTRSWPLITACSAMCCATKRPGRR